MKLKNKKILFFLLTGLSILILLSGCNSNKPSSQDTSNIEYKKISPSEAKEKLQNEEGILLLDVRTDSEYKEKHIPKSMLIPIDVLKNEVINKIPDKNTTILVYCRSGNRSRSASKILINLGYTNVYDLGGIINWPYEVESVE